MMANKLGLDAQDSSLKEIADKLLLWLEKMGADYTNTFLALIERLPLQDNTYNDPEFLAIKNALYALAPDTTLMAQNNPAFIPRNYIV